MGERAEALTVRGVLAGAGLAIVAGDVWLVVICWKHRTVLGALGGLVGIPLVLFAVLTGLAGGTGMASLGIALMFLILGACLYVLGHALERLLDEEAENET